MMLVNRFPLKSQFVRLVMSEDNDKRLTLFWFTNIVLRFVNPDGKSRLASLLPVILSVVRFVKS